jgi:hypothetical protein
MLYKGQRHHIFYDLDTEGAVAINDEDVIYDLPGNQVLSYHMCKSTPCFNKVTEALKYLLDTCPTDAISIQSIPVLRMLRDELDDTIKLVDATSTTSSPVTIRTTFSDLTKDYNELVKAVTEAKKGIEEAVEEVKEIIG